MARDALLCINGNAGKHTLYKSVVPTTSHTPGVGKKLKTLFRGGTSGSEQEGGGSETFTFEQARALSEYVLYFMKIYHIVYVFYLSLRIINVAMCL